MGGVLAHAGCMKRTGDGATACAARPILLPHRRAKPLDQALPVVQGVIADIASPISLYPRATLYRRNEEANSFYILDEGLPFALAGGLSFERLEQP